MAAVHLPDCRHPVRVAGPSAHCRAPRPSARPTPAPSARTASPCSTRWTGRRRPRSCAGCRRSACCGGCGSASSCAGTGRRRKEKPQPAGEPVESLHDPEARYRTRSGTAWVGYLVHLTETCDDDTVNLITHAMTTVATVHEARCTEAIHAALAGRGLVPAEHLVDAAYVDAELLVRSREDHGIDLVGPPRPNPSWQAKLEGGHTPDRFEVDWDKGQVRCPQGKLSSAWNALVERSGAPYIRVQFRAADCGACPARPLCARAGQARRGPCAR